jgi:hypothetical protein
MLTERFESIQSVYSVVSQSSIFCVQAEKDLKASRVKIAARDVLLSKKIVFSIMAVPVLWITYALLLCIFTRWEKRTIFVLFLACPAFSYVGKTMKAIRLPRCFIILSLLIVIRSFQA